MRPFATSFNHQGEDKSAKYKFSYNAHEAAYKTGSGPLSRDFIGENVDNLGSARTGHGKRIDAKGKHTHDITLGNVGALHQAKSDGIESDQSYQAVHAAVSKYSGGDHYRKYAGDISSGLGCALFEEGVRHSIAYGTHGTGTVVHLGDQITGKDRREQRLNHCSKSGKVHIGKRLSEVQPV